jgi:hypothetical protein
MTSFHARIFVLLSVAVAAVVAVALHAPIAQPAGYHLFADQRLILGIPNFWNVVSNLGFLVVGWAGSVVLSNRMPLGALPPLRALYRWFFAGAILVAIGSAYYHWSPNDQTLVWDRLPMTVSFMAFFSIIIGEQLSIRAGRVLLYPLMVVGFASVIYWHLSEGAGRGDLRPYLVVQFLPMALVPLIMLLFPARYSHGRLVWGLLGAYVAAKLFEIADEQIYAYTHFISGHTLKHFAAAFGMLLFLVALLRRRSMQ